MNPNHLITSMFTRRLIILAGCFIVAIAVLIGQLYRLTVVHGSELRHDAEGVLVERHLLPTIRGRILDRKGRVLAEDQPCFDVLVDYRVISGAWAVTQAGREAQRTLGEKWDTLSREERDQLIRNVFRGRYDREVEQLWQQMATLSDTPVDNIDKRVSKVEAQVERMAHSVWERWRRQRERAYQTAVTLEDVKRPIREQQLPHVILRRIDSSKEAAFRRLALAGPYISKDQPAVTIQSAGTRATPWATQNIEMTRRTLPSPLRSDKPLMFHLQDVGIGSGGGGIIGNMRDTVFKEDLARRPMRNSMGKLIDLGGYQTGDDVGSSGIERSYEDTLRGRRGVVVHHLDTGETERTPPQPGRDVTLSIDIRLQARLNAILMPEMGLTVVQPWHGQESQLPVGTPLAASAVVLDIETGEILALASHTPEEWDEIAPNSPDGPTVARPTLVNRAVDKPYPCGSIVKPLMLNAAIASGVWKQDQEVECNGHYFPNDPDHFRCWIYRARFGYATHGLLGPVEAIARSCNIYFYTIADALKQTRIVEWYRKWGVGDRFDLGIPTTGGLIRSPDKIDRGELLMMGIGQGPVAWTPLHAANAYAALVRGGYFTEPVLVVSPSRSNNSNVSSVSSGNKKERREDLGLDGQAVDMAMEGLHEVIHNQQYGGARHMDVNPDPDVREFEPILNVEGIETWGKTGTAQDRPWPTALLAIDERGQVRRDRNGKPILINRPKGTGAHSWFVGLAGKKHGDDAGENPTVKPQPQFVIAVLVEWGGSGSRCAGPIANQVMQALKDEGYFD